ncbi:MAG: hypothetical protein WC683_02400 [bacterium]
MTTVFIPAKKAPRTRLSGFGGVSSQSIFMATNRPKPIPRGMGAADGAALVSAALRRPLQGLGAQMIAAKFNPIQAQFTPVSTSTDGGSTTAWLIGGVVIIAAVGGLVYLSTRKR